MATLLDYPDRQFSDLVLPTQSMIIASNTAEDVGFAGKHNTELRPDVQLYDMRSALTVARSDVDRRVVVTAKHAHDRVLRLLEYVRDDRGFDHLLPDDAYLPIPFSPKDTMMIAVRNHAGTVLSAAAPERFQLVPSMYSAEVEAFAAEHPEVSIPGSRKLTETLSNKALLSHLVMCLGVSQPRTIPAYSIDEAHAAFAQFEEGGQLPLYVKGSRGAGGYAMRIVNDKEEFADALRFLDFYLQEGKYRVPEVGTPYGAYGIVLQECVEGNATPGVCMRVGSATRFREHLLLGVTEQDLKDRKENKGNVHHPNMYASANVVHMEHAMRSIANYIQREGGEGLIFGADFVIPADQRRPPLLVDLNLRPPAQFNGLAVSHQLFGRTDPAHKHYYVGDVPLRTPHATDDTVEPYLRHLQQARTGRRSAEFDPKAHRGILPMNLLFRDLAQVVIVGNSAKDLRELREVAEM